MPSKPCTTSYLPSLSSKQSQIRYSHQVRVMEKVAEQLQQGRVLRLPSNLPWMRSVHFSGWILLSTSHSILSKDLTLKFNLHHAYGSSAGICSTLSLLHSQASMSTAVRSHLFTLMSASITTSKLFKIMTLPPPPPQNILSQMWPSLRTGK